MALRRGSLHPTDLYQTLPAWGLRATLARLPLKRDVALLQSARGMLEFTILTAARSGETLGAVWSEIDLTRQLWTIPAARMKAGREHRVPLTARTVEILGVALAARTTDYVFPGQKAARPLSNMSMEMLLRRMGEATVTTHGFRSSFRDWAGERTEFPREVAEAALAHQVGDETERAYRRGDALEKRRKLMEAWELYLMAQAPAGTFLLS